MARSGGCNTSCVTRDVAIKLLLATGPLMIAQRINPEMKSLFSR
jgi:hypothetical protein